MVRKRPIVTAELSINHLGMVNIAKSMVKSAKDSGASLIKIKCKDVDKYYEEEGKKWRNFNFKKYRRSLELSSDDIKELTKYCQELNIGWFCTVHDLQGLDFIKQLKPAMYKVASMDSNNDDLVNAVMDLCSEDKKPFVVSIGGKSEDFTDKLINKINHRNLTAYILHTVSIYPTPTGRSNINYIKTLKKYESDSVKIGYSGHEEGCAATLLATTLGVSMIERHFTLTRDYNIHHIKSGLIPEEFKRMCALIDDIIREKNCGIIKCAAEEDKFLKNRVYE